MKDVSIMFNQFLYSMTAEEITAFNKLSDVSIRAIITSALSANVTSTNADKIVKEFNKMLDVLSKDDLRQLSTFGDGNIKAMISEKIQSKS